jgi:hypothetical protein
MRFSTQSSVRIGVVPPPSKGSAKAAKAHTSVKSVAASK